NDSGCAAATFSLQPSLPQGWTTNLLGSSVSLAAGSSTTISLQVTSAASASSGADGLPVRASHSDKAKLFASASTTYTVASSAPGGRSVNLSLARPPATVYRLKKTVPLSARVTSSGQPLSGAPVSFTITKPDGSIVTASYQTKKNGQ